MSTRDETSEQQGGLDLLGDMGIAIWVELFYDLIYVAAMLIFSAAVETVRPESGVVWIIASFAAAWWIWFSTTACANRFHSSDLIHRLLLLFQMLVIVLMAMESRVSVIGDSTWLAGEYGTLLITVAIMYWRASRAGGEHARAALALARINLIAAVIFLVAPAVSESARLILCLIGMAVAVVPTMITWHQLETFSRRDEGHFVERMAAFTLIVCGEAFIEVALRVSGPKIIRLDLVSLGYEFLLTFAMFSLYFRDITAAGLQQRRFGWWAFWHLVMMIGIAGTAIGSSLLVSLDPSHHIANVEIIKLTGSLVMFFVGLAGIGCCGRRSPQGPLLRVRLATAAIVAAVGVFAWIVPWMHLAEVLPAFLVVTIGAVVISSRLRSSTTVLPAEEFAAQR
jgi:low temperature requirement protein LtrA